MESRRSTSSGWMRRALGASTHTWNGQAWSGWMLFGRKEGETEVLDWRICSSFLCGRCLIQACLSGPKPWAPSPPVLSTVSATMDHTLDKILTDFIQALSLGGCHRPFSGGKSISTRYHDFYLDQVRTFVGKDASLVNSLMLLHPERVITVWHNDLQSPARVYTSPTPGLKDLILGDCGDPPPLLPILPGL